MELLENNQDRMIFLDEFWDIKPKTMSKKVWNNKLRILERELTLLKSINTMDIYFDRIGRTIKLVGGVRSNLVFFNGLCCWIPHLWEIVSKGLRNNTAKSFNAIYQWFAIQGFNEEFNIPPDKILLRKVDVADLDQLIQPVPCLFYYKNPKAAESRSASPYIQTIRNLFIRASEKYPELRKIGKFTIKENGNNIEKITNHSAYIKYSRKLPIKGELYVPKYNEELISAVFRLAYYEYQSKQVTKISTNVKSMRSLFNSNKGRKWIVTRSIPNNDPDFKFLVMLDEFAINMMTILFDLFQHGEWVNNVTNVNELIHAAQINWPHGSLQQINKARMRAQLTNAELLSRKPTWSFSEAVEFSAFQGWLERGYELPTKLFGKHGLLWENKRGPLNYFLEALFINPKFRKGVNQQSKVYLSIDGSEVRSDYVGSFGNKPKFLGQTTCHLPDVASHFIPDLGYTEFVNFKRESDVSSYHAIIDLLKGHNAQNQHYRNFQMNIYTKRDIYDVKGLKHKRKLIELIKNEDTDGIIVFTIPENLTTNLSRFGEIFNSARLEWKQY